MSSANVSPTPNSTLLARLVRAMGTLFLVALLTTTAHLRPEAGRAVLPDRLTELDQAARRLAAEVKHLETWRTSAVSGRLTKLVVAPLVWGVMILPVVVGLDRWTKGYRRGSIVTAGWIVWITGTLVLWRCL